MVHTVWHTWGGVCSTSEGRCGVDATLDTMLNVCLAASYAKYRMEP